MTFGCYFPQWNMEAATERKIPSAVHSPPGCVITPFGARCPFDKVHWSAAVMAVECNLSRHGLTPNEKMTHRILIGNSA